MRRSVLERLARLEKQALDAQRLALAEVAAREAEARLREARLRESWESALRAPPAEAALFAALGPFGEANRGERNRLAAEARVHARAAERLTAELRERMTGVKRYELLAERLAAREREERRRRWADELDDLAACRRRR